MARRGIKLVIPHFLITKFHKKGKVVNWNDVRLLKTGQNYTVSYF